MVLSLNSYHSKSNQRTVVLHLLRFRQFFPVLTISAPAKVIVAAIHGARTAAAKLEIMAGAVMGIVPIILLFLILQKYIMTGMSKAAMK